MLDKILATVFVAIALVGLALMLVRGIRMTRPEYFEQIRAGTNPDTNQLKQFLKAPPRWIALFILLASIAIAALNVAIIRDAVHSGHVMGAKNLEYFEARSPTQFWLNVGQSACDAGLMAFVTLWSLRALFRRKAKH